MAAAPFATDEQLAARIRRVASELRKQEPAATAELLEVAWILDPEPSAPTSPLRASERLFAA